MLCCIVSLGVGRLFNNSLITTILASCLFDWRCIFMLSVSSSPLSSFPHPYLLCLHSCRQWDLRQTCPPAAYSLSFSTVPVAGCWRPCSLLLSLLVLCSHQGLAVGRRNTVRNPSWVLVALLEYVSMGNLGLQLQHMQFRCSPALQ